MRTLVWFTYFWAKLLLLLPTLRRAQQAEAAGDAATRDTILQKEVVGWCSRLLRLAGASIEVDGREHLSGEPVVFVANHQGYFDIPLMLTCLDKPHGLVAKEAIGKLPFIRDWMRLLGCVFIDRSNARQSVAALGEAAQRLTQDSRSFVIFPEGTRSKGGPLGEFKSGGFKIAFKSGVPIQPVCIDGSWRLMEGNHNWIRPAKVHVTILPPIPTHGLSREEMKALVPAVEQQISALLSQPA